MHKGLVAAMGALSHWGELLEDKLNGHAVAIVSGPVQPVAAPRVGFRSVRQASTDGIQMNVAYQFEKDRSPRHRGSPCIAPGNSGRPNDGAR